MNKWFCISGKQLTPSKPRNPPAADIMFYVKESSKPKALIAASKLKTSYRLQHPKPADIQFEFNQPLVLQVMERDWTPEQLAGRSNNGIIIVVPYEGNGNKLRSIKHSYSIKLGLSMSKVAQG